MTLSNQTMLNRNSCTAQSTAQFNSKTDEEESPNNVEWRETTNWIWPFVHKRQRSTTLTTIVLPLLLLPSLTMTAQNVITKYLSIHCRGDVLVRVCAQNRCIRGRLSKSNQEYSSVGLSKSGRWLCCVLCFRPQNEKFNIFFVHFVNVENLFFSLSYFAWPIQHRSFSVSVQSVADPCLPHVRSVCWCCGYSCQIKKSSVTFCVRCIDAIALRIV